MKKRTWVIIGATSIIAEAFARLAAQQGHPLILVGRHHAQLEVIAADITWRFHVPCDVITADFSNDIDQFLKILGHCKNIDLFIAHSDLKENRETSRDTIPELVNTNITNTIQLIHAYWHKKQTKHQLIFLSSVAAVRGRARNSLYGASKAAVEVYLEGLQQGAMKNKHITIARLGYIDTRNTYGQARIFYASPPKACASACWKALHAQKRLIYHPFFWRYIMTLIAYVPFFMYRRMRDM